MCVHRFVMGIALRFHQLCVRTTHIGFQKEDCISPRYIAKRNVFCPEIVLGEIVIKSPYEMYVCVCACMYVSVCVCR